MRSFISWPTIVLLLGCMAVGCKNGQSEANPSVSASVPEPEIMASAQTQEHTGQTLEGELQFEDLEGGTWRLLTSEQTWVLRAAAGRPSLETMLSESKLQSGAKVQVHGWPASAEENIGINMAGPYFEVDSLKAQPR
ncbi:MAG: hypothetical protein Q4F00_11595 [bacterium]|nr:hypothetical protein [bacterium]